MRTTFVVKRDGKEIGRVSVEGDVKTTPATILASAAHEAAVEAQIVARDELEGVTFIIA